MGNIEMMRHAAGGYGWTRTYYYDKPNNQLTRTNVDGQIYNYTYNVHGSMETVPHLNQQIGWNGMEEMQHLHLGGGGEAWYVYDGNGQRVRKIIERPGNRREERMYIGGFEVYREYSGNNVILERETLHIMDDKQRIAMVETKTGEAALIRYQYSDHLGSTALELDEQAGIISYEEYHPFGTTAYQATDSTKQVPAKRYRYTGMERDDETGLNYHSARYYMPWLGRWMSCDPMGAAGGLNFYRYCDSNPITLVDLNGKLPKIPTLQEIKEKANQRLEQAKAVAKQAFETVKETAEKGVETAKPVEVGLAKANVQLVSEVVSTAMEASQAVSNPLIPVIAVVAQAKKNLAAPAKFVERKLAGDTTSDALLQATEEGLKVVPFQQVATDVDKAVKAEEQGDTSAATEHAVVAGGHFALEVVQTALALEGATSKPPSKVAIEGSVGGDPWEGSVGAAKRTDTFQRIMSTAEAEQLHETRRLQPQVSSKGNTSTIPKMIAEEGALGSLIKKKLKSHTHIADIITRGGTAEWVEANARPIEGEPGRYELDQGPKLEYFNEQIIRITINPLRPKK